METGTEDANSTVPYIAKTYGSSSASLYLDASLSAPVNGNKSLRMDTGAIGGNEDRYLIFANTFGAGLNSNKDATFAKYGIDITPGKRWILSWYWKANTQSLDASTQTPGTNTALNMDLMVANTTHFIGGTKNYVTATLHAANGLATDTWQRNHVIFDLQSGVVSSDDFDQYDSSVSNLSGDSPLSEINSVIPFVSLRSNASHGNITYWLDSIQLEQVGNNIYTPSQFKEPSDKAALLHGRRITDGKIITHVSPEFSVTGGAVPYAGAPDPFYYGPKANVTPNGYPNPEPHGDLWFNTSNNNMLFRYHQNATDYSAQSAWYLYEPDLTQTSNSGWYLAEDNRFGQFFSNLLTMNTQIYDALANVAAMQKNVDHDIVTFFVPEDGSLFGNAIANPSANFGDIWINTSDYNANLTHGGLTTNAIFRYQNGTSYHSDYTFGRTTPPVGSVGDLKWYHAPTDTLGVIYLETALNRNAADQKTVTYFMAGLNDGDSGHIAGLGYHGPNVAITPSGVLNPNPRNDLWVDTANGYQLHIYKANQDFSNSFVGTHSDKAFWDPTRRAGTWSIDGSPSGWYDVSDSRIEQTRQDLIANAASISYALSNSVSAKAIADRELISYYEVEGVILLHRLLLEDLFLLVWAMVIFGLTRVIGINCLMDRSALMPFCDFQIRPEVRLTPLEVSLLELHLIFPGTLLPITPSVKFFLMHI